MVGLAHKFAFECAQVTAEAISAVAVPELARAYQVLSTPHIVLNHQVHRRGLLHEAQLLVAIQQL